MGSSALSGTIEPERSTEVWLWLAAVALFGIGDLVTTTVGINLAGVREVGPLTAVLLDRYGFVSMVVSKSIVLGGFYLVWKRTPREYRVGVPLGLAALGGFVVCWNFVVGIVAIS